MASASAQYFGAQISLRNLPQIASVFGGDVAVAMADALAHVVEELALRHAPLATLEHSDLGTWAFWPKSDKDCPAIMAAIKDWLEGAALQPMSFGGNCVIPALQLEKLSGMGKDRTSLSRPSRLRTGNENFASSFNALTAVEECDPVEFGRANAISAALLVDLRLDCLAWAARPVVASDRLGAVLYQSARRYRIDDGGRYVDLAPELEALERLRLRRIYDAGAMKWALSRLRSDPDLAIGVSLAPSSLECDPWWDDVSAALAGDSSLGRRLYLEVPATLPDARCSPAADLCQRLRGLGARIVLDDFGGERTMLSLLHRLTPDAIKVAGISSGCKPAGPDWDRAQRALVEMASAFAPCIIIDQAATHGSGLRDLPPKARWVQDQCVTALMPGRALVSGDLAKQSERSGVDHWWIDDLP